MTLTAILAIMGIKYIQSSIPQWRRDVDTWMKNDIKGFLKFKKEVFEIVNSSKRHSERDGFEIIHPKV